MELCRLRASLDPIYALPVIVCPGCATACVRRRHPTSAGWRTFLRVFASCRFLVFQLVLLGVLTLLFGTFLYNLQHDLAREWPMLRAAWSDPQFGGVVGLRRELVRSRTIFELIAWGFFATGLGAWLVAGLAHWRLWKAVLSWAGAMLAVFLVALVLDCGEVWIDSNLLRGRARAWPDAGSYLGAYALALATLPLAIPGGAIGLGIRAVARAAARRRFRKARSRARKRREG